MTSTTHKPQAPAAPSRTPRRLGLLLTVLAALTLARSLSEGIYDIAFANLALDLTGAVSTVGLVYCVGYGVEVIASITTGPLLDRGNPKNVLILSYLAKIGVFVLIGIGSTFLSSHLWAIVAAAATVDLVHHIGDMALFVLLPRLLDPKTLVRVQGISGSVRSASELISPVAAGATIVILPGSQGLLAAAALQILALTLFLTLTTLITAVSRHRPHPDPATTPTDDETRSTPQPPAKPVTRRTVAKTMTASPAWRRFALFHSLTVLALSTVILSLLPLMRDTLDMSAAHAGTYLAFPTIGAIVGGLLVAKAGPDGIHPNMQWSPAVAGTGTLTTAFLGPTPWLLATGLTLFGLGFTVYLRSAGLLIQLHAPATLLGTWNGLLDATIRTLSATAILATGILFDHIGGQPVYLALGTLLLTTTTLWATFNKHHKHTLDATPLHTTPSLT